MDHGQLTGIVFLEFRKAFDSVGHALLLQKLARYMECRTVNSNGFKATYVGDNRRQSQAQADLGEGALSARVPLLMHDLEEIYPFCTLL